MMKNFILAYATFMLSTILNLASALLLFYQIQGFWVVATHAFTGIYLFLNIFYLVALPKGRSFLMNTIRRFFAFQRSRTLHLNRTILFKSIHGLFFALLIIQYFSGLMLATHLLTIPFLLTLHRVLTLPTLFLAFCHLFIETLATIKASTHR